jgi:hypothetical protein
MTGLGRRFQQIRAIPVASAMRCAGTGRGRGVRWRSVTAYLGCKFVGSIQRHFPRFPREILASNCRIEAGYRNSALR